MTFGVRGFRAAVTAASLGLLLSVVYSGSAIADPAPC